MTRRKQALALLLAAAALVPLAASGRLGEERADVFAAVRFTPEPGRVEANRARLAGLVREAARAGARYVVLPELATTGPRPASPEPVPGPTTRFFGELARELDLWIALALPEQAAGGYHVTTVLIDDRGEVLARHRKVLPRPADGPLVRGNPRDIPRSLDDRGRRLGVLSGDDLLAGVPQLASRGAETVLVSAAWGPGEPVAWEELCRRLSREHQVNLVVAGTGIFKRSGEAVRGGEIVSASLTAPDSWLPAPPLGLPSLPVPAAEPLTPELVELGRALFFDRSLSRDRSTACATCHQPERAFANGERAGTGIYGNRTPRNVPSLLNVAFRGALFWDGYAGTLENQVKYPVSHAFEMDSPYLDGMLDAVRANPEYRRGFRRALGREEIGFDDVARALAAYQRVLLSANSPFDRYLYGGQHEALTPAARRGLDLFTGKAGCASCHAVGPDHALFQDDAFHNTGVGWDPAAGTAGAFTDGGLGLLSDASRVGQFFTPSLRNVALTAPYMHDGSLATLDDVVAFYDRGGNPNPGLDPRLRPLRLDERERADLVAFLRSLTGDRAFSADGRPLDRHRPWTLPVGELARFAVLRFAPEPGQVEKNRAALAGLVERAAGRGASFVVLPEHAETGPLAPGASPKTEESVAFLSELARRHGLWIAAAAGGRETVLVDPEGLPVLSQPKLFPRPERGDGTAERGDLRRLRTVPTPAGRLGVLAGDDLREGVARLAELGAETVLVSASWTRGDAVDWSRFARELAAEHRVNLVVSNLVEPGEEPGLFVVLVGEGGEISDLLPPGHVADAPVVTVSLAPRERAKPQPGLPPVPRPAGSLAGPEAVELGRRLFFDPILSADASVSCASCHRPELGFADGRKVSRGIAGRDGQRNTPTLLNVAYRPFLFWEGRARTLEEQVLHAVQGWFEMASDAGEALERVRRDPEYRRAFRRVTGRDELRWGDVAAALAAFERTLVSGGSPFDRWYYGGEASAVSERARRGFRVFAGAGRCASCHTLGERAALFSDLGFHNTGVGFHERFIYLGYGGDGVEGNVARDNRFRGEYLTPSLRNIAQTAPYMHDGSLATLRDVVDFYARGGIPNPHLDPAMQPLTLSERDKEDLVEFLHTLTGPLPPAARDAGRMIASHGGGR